LLGLTPDQVELLRSSVTWNETFHRRRGESVCTALMRSPPG
jgi:hypothetical protein